MALINFLRLFSIFSLAILNISLSALPVDALAVERGHIGRGLNHAHAGLAKRNDSSGRCRPRPISSSPDLSPTPHPYHAPSSQPAPASHSSSHTTSSSTTSHSHQPSGSTSISKFGISWSNHEEQSITNVITPGSPKRLVMNWDYRGYGDIISLPDNLQYMATIAKIDFDGNDVVRILKKNAGIYSPKIRTFNEPDIDGPGKLSAGEAHSYIKTYLYPVTLLYGYQILSPAVTTSPDGLKWLRDYHSLGDSGAYMTDVHHYSLSCSALKASVNDFSEFGYPLYYSEVGAHDYYRKLQATSSQVDDMLNCLLDLCANDPRIDGCQWFGWFRLGEIPGKLSNENCLLECPNNVPGKDCKPNGRGYKWLGA